jgi:hypothetical protein
MGADFLKDLGNYDGFGGVRDGEWFLWPKAMERRLFVGRSLAMIVAPVTMIDRCVTRSEEFRFLAVRRLGVGSAQFSRRYACGRRRMFSLGLPRREKR